MLDLRFSGRPSARSIADAIFEAIRNEVLTEGDPLPSVRQLADQLKCSPATVASAFRLLRERGLVTSGHGRVSRVAGRPAVPQTLSPRTPAGVRDLSLVSPDPALLPDVARHVSPALYRAESYAAPSVSPELAAAAAEFFSADGIAGSVSVLNSALDAVQRVLELYLRPGDAVVIEDPVWVALDSLMSVLGLTTLRVPVDDEGLKPTELAEALASCRIEAIVLTPRGQNPYGSAMSVRRAAELRRVLAAHPDVLVLEDDHASLVAGAAHHTLTAGRSRWGVVRSMSKVLGLDLRCTLLASDEYTAHRLQGRYLLGPAWVSHFVQRLVAVLLTDDETRADVDRARDEYAERRRRLVEPLRAAGVEAHGVSGLNVLVPVPDEGEVVAQLVGLGWKVQSGAGYRRSAGGFIRVCSALLEPADADRLAVDLIDVLRPGPVR